MKLPKVYVKILSMLNLAGKFNKQQRWLFKNAAKDKYENIRDLMTQEAVIHYQKYVINLSSPGI